MAKDFKSAGKPAMTREMEAFVDGGRGKDAPVQIAVAKAPTADLQRISMDIDKDVHRRFKIACATEQLKMVDVMRELIEGWVTTKGY